MARLPQLLAESSVNPRAGAVGIDRPDLFDPTARALGGLGDAAERSGLTVAAVEKNARDTRDVLAATTEASRQLDQYRIELESEADPARRETLFRQRAEQMKQQLGKPLSGSAALDFEQGFERAYAVQAHGVRDKARRDEIAAAADTLDQSTNTLLDLAIRERDPRKRALHLEEIAGNIEQARSAGILSKAQADRLHKATLEKFEKLEVTELRRTNPARALQLLTAPPDKGGFKYLDPLAKRELALALQREMEQRSALAKLQNGQLVDDAVRTMLQGQAFSRIGDAWRAAATDPRLTEKLATAQRAYEETAEFRTKTLPQMREQIDLADKANAAAGTDSTSLAILDAQKKTYAALLQGYRSDQMGTAIARNPAAAQALTAAETTMADANASSDQVIAARDAYQAALRELARTQQEDGGVPAHRVAVLPKATVAQMVGDLAGLEGQRRLDYIDRQQAKLGPELWRAAWRQLAADPHLPGDVRVIAAIPPGPSANADRAVISEAMKIPDKDWETAIPDADTRKQFGKAVAAAGEQAREAMAMAPGGIDLYRRFAAAAETTAKFLYAQKRAANPEAAASQAWAMVYGNHWMHAGTVRIPQTEGVPAIAPALVSQYQDYVKANLDRWYLAAPPPTAGTAGLTDAQRLDLRRRILKRDGRWVANADETGMVLLDGMGLPARLQNGTVLEVGFDEIGRDLEFDRWQRGATERERLPRGVAPPPALTPPPPPPASPPAASPPPRTREADPLYQWLLRRRGR